MCAVLLFCVIAAGCSGPAASPTAPNAKNSSTRNTATQAAASSKAVTPTATPTAKPTATPFASATPTPSAFPTPTSSPSAGGSSSLILQFYYRQDCPYCQALEPQITQLQSTYAGKVTVQWTESPGEVPTLVLLNNGAEVGRWVNPGTTAPITAKIDSLLTAG